MNDLIAENAIIENNVYIGEGTRIWYFSHIREGAKIGRNVSIGDYCFIDSGVIIGDDVKIGNKVSVYKGVIIKDRVFVGNNAVFTNVRKPKTQRKGKMLDTIIDEDVSIGANATIVAGVKIGKGSIVSDGAVVFFDVPEKVFVAGNPAKVKRKHKDYDASQI